MNGTTPLWTAIVLAVVSRALPRSAQIAGLAVGFAGVVVIFEPWQQGAPGELAGVLACLAAAALYGVSHVYLSRFVTPLDAHPVALATGNSPPRECRALLYCPSTAEPLERQLRSPSWQCSFSVSSGPVWPTC